MYDTVTYYIKIRLPDGSFIYDSQLAGSRYQAIDQSITEHREKQWTRQLYTLITRTEYYDSSNK